MDDQSDWPRLMMSLMLVVDATLWYVSTQLDHTDENRADRVGFVDNEETISSGRFARKAPRQFIVRGT
jgi:hypothetical protein